MRAVFVTESEVVKSINEIIDEAKRNNKQISFIELSRTELNELLEYDKNHTQSLLNDSYKGYKLKVVEE